MGLLVIVDGVFGRILVAELRRGKLAPLLVLLFRRAAAQEKINVMQCLGLKVFRQMLRLFKKQFSGAHTASMMALKTVEIKRRCGRKENAFPPGKHAKPVSTLFPLPALIDAFSIPTACGRSVLRLDFGPRQPEKH